MSITCRKPFAAAFLSDPECHSGDGGTIGACLFKELGPAALPQGDVTETRRQVRPAWIFCGTCCDLAHQFPDLNQEVATTFFDETLIGSPTATFNGYT
jgi:hypothetical protein